VNLAGASLLRLAYLRHAGNTCQEHPRLSRFLALWKDADPDVPILKEAKAEYAKLQ
jgi:hypothetical protein